MNIAIITVGDELLNGQTIDTNATWLGLELNKIGLSIACKMSVGDTAEDITSALDFCYSKADIVITTGGLGPTHDDITKETIATYFGDELIFDQGTYDHITNFFAQRGRKPTHTHRAQSHMPRRASLIKNERGTAPGMWFSEGKKYLLSMPGVPSEMKWIMTSAGLDKIQKVAPKQFIHHEIIKTAGIGETMIAEQIQDIIDRLPPHIGLAYLPGAASVRVRLTSKNQSQDYTDIIGFRKEIVSRIAAHVYGYGDDTLESVICGIAADKGLKIGLAESCTGGAICAKLVSVSGASACLEGTIVSYSNALKEKLLNVSPHTLTQHGAVSEAAVTEMAKGALAALDVDVALSVSGIAGPTGGSPDKPVGTIWICVASKGLTQTKKLQLNKSRKLNIQYTVASGLFELYQIVSKM